MPVELDHTIITMKNVDEATAFYAKILGMKFEGKMGDFSIMRVTASLTLDFEEAEPGETIERGHFAFAMTSLTRSSNGSKHPAFPMVKGQVKPRTCVVPE